MDRETGTKNSHNPLPFLAFGLILPAVGICAYWDPHHSIIIARLDCRMLYTLSVEKSSHNASTNSARGTAQQDPQE